MPRDLPADLLIELGCEDLPARYMSPLAEALRAGFLGGLAKRGVAHGEAQLFATPRRLALLVRAVQSEQAEQTIDLTGPALNVAVKDGQPTPAALGFAKKCGVEFSALGQKDGKLHYARTEAGKPTAELIPAIFEDTLKGMDELVPKRMRWGSGDETFVRPVSWLVCLLGSEVVPLARFGLQSGRVSYGHRFHAPAAISLAAPADYAAALKAAKVWAEVDSRKAEIERQIKAEVATLQGHARINPELLDEVTALVEWPVVIVGRMEDRFMALPPEVIVATVETNQRYFTVFEDAALTRLKPVFITIANIESRDVAQVIEGNERVVRPRLSDAMFFWEQDLKKSLAMHGVKLEAMSYVKGLGTLADRQQRITNLAGDIADELDIEGIDVELVRRAATLCKSDLVTRMVFEFPELQGIVGGYYAMKSGEPETVGLAIREHYLPAQHGTSIPNTREGQVIALADKADQLAGIFKLNLKPTASKDPYALRRAANGLLRITIEGRLPVDLEDLLKGALADQPMQNEAPSVLSDLVEFVMERLRALLVTGSVTTEMFEAVKATGITQPLDFALRIDALKSFVALPASANLAAAHKRIRKILKQASDEGVIVDPNKFRAERFEHDAERALFAVVSTLNLEGDYTARLLQLATLREPVDAFFNGVMVNADDAAVRSNRLALLARLDKLCRSVADISLLPG